MRKKLSVDEKFILIAIPILYGLGALFHFVYDWSGGNFLVSLVAPKNESIWEHIKLAVIPTILWWTLQYSISRARLKPIKKAWFSGALVATVVSAISIPLVYYFYTGAFGVENPIIDMLILLVGNVIGQLAGLSIVRRGKGVDAFSCVCALVVIVATFALLTIYPPNFPIFTPPII